MSEEPRQQLSSSCPALCRASTSSFSANGKDVDGRGKPGHDRIIRRRIARAAAFATTIIVATSVAFACWVVTLGPLPLEQAREVSTVIVDRNGKLLRAYAMADGRWRLPVDATTDVDPTYLKL
jgi:penicillin-binding protein 1C